MGCCRSLFFLSCRPPRSHSGANNLRSQTMSGILRAAAPLARRLNAVPKGPIAQQTRGMACECPERRAVSYLPPSHPGLDYRLVP